MSADREIVRRTRLRFVLAAVSCVVFIAFLLLLAGAAHQDPLRPLRDVGFSALGVGINFIVALGSVGVFGYWRRKERDRDRRRRDGGR